MSVGVNRCSGSSRPTCHGLVGLGTYLFRGCIGLKPGFEVLKLLRNPVSVQVGRLELPCRFGSADSNRFVDPVRLSRIALWTGVGFLARCQMEILRVLFDLSLFKQAFSDLRLE